MPTIACSIAFGEQQEDVVISSPFSIDDSILPAGKDVLLLIRAGDGTLTMQRIREAADHELNALDTRRDTWQGR